MNENIWLVIGSLIAGLGVILGAFGAHALEGAVSASRLETYQTAVRYQMYHGMALLFLHLLRDSLSGRFTTVIGLGFSLGVVLFSGSLYLLVLTDTSLFGAITPLGGILFIASWILLAYDGWYQAGV